MVSAFEAWYRSEHPKVVSSLTVIAGNVSLAQEAADEAFARALERWRRVSTMAAPTGWAYRTALNVLRRRAHRAEIERRLLRVRREPEVAPPADWSVEVWDALRRLPLRQRTALALRYVADLSTEEIAEVMNVSPGTVGSTLNAARRNLALLLATEEQPPLSNDMKGAADG